MSSEDTTPTPAVAADAEAPAPAPASKEEETAAAPAATDATADGEGEDSKAEEGGKKKRRKRWLPLESNPEVMNKYIAGLGFPTIMYKFVDVLSTDDWALEMVPGPAKAVMLLFPISEMSEKHRNEEATAIEKDGQVVADRVYYTKQTVGNACGTVGLIHAVANCGDVLGGDVPLEPGTFFHNFITRTKGMSPGERAAALEEDDALDAAQAVATREGVTAVPDVNDAVDAHFICFVEVDGHLYELDGRKKFPINHGPCESGMLLYAAAKAVKQFTARDPTSYNFAVTALVPNTD